MNKTQWKLFALVYVVSLITSVILKNNFHWSNKRLYVFSAVSGFISGIFIGKMGDKDETN